MEIAELKIKLKEILPKGIDKAIEEVKKVLSNRSRLYDELVLIESKFNSLKHQFSNNLIKLDDYNQGFSQITLNVIDLINLLEEEDRREYIQDQNGISDQKGYKRGYSVHEVPNDFVKTFRELFREDDNNIKQVAFFSDYGWIILMKNSGFAYNWIPKELEIELMKAHQNKKVVKRIAISQNQPNSWVILFENNFFICSSNIPTTLYDELNVAYHDNEIIEKIIFLPNDGWIVLYESGGYSCENVQKDLRDEMIEIFDHGSIIQEVVIAPNFGWVIICHNQASFSNNITESLCKKIMRMSKLRTKLYLLAISSNNGWVTIEERLGKGS